MDLQLSDKTAFVSGSTAGIGLAIAEGLAREGAKVWINGRTTERVESALRQIRSSQPNANVQGVAADLGTAEGADLLQKQLTSVDILVNNLGIFEPKPFAEITDEDWRRFFEVNVLSGVRLSRLYLAGMRRKNWGRILFVSSESGVQIPVEMVHYGFSKTAQLAIARGVAETVASTGITVNSILPGPTRSEGVERFIEDIAAHSKRDQAAVERDFFLQQRPSSLIQRFASVEEVANLAVYLASPLSSATTGAALRVDGGVVRSIV